MESINAVAAAPVVLTRSDSQVIGSNQASARGDSVEEKKGSTSVSVGSANSAAQAFKSFVQDIQRNLDFSVDDSSGQVVVKVIDGESGKLIRQIPSEELLRLSERLEDMRSLLFKAQA
ncbi:flagellar protein FlaG [Stutzerimonas stutzeri]|jgi:flagellar protein FlaG|uniref:flagellar protein FlaG n=1 Tax=Stutzerimonas stutzeri TaxID=316 RepID=UPI00177C1AB2|nr:flagellar protein FlaG [Stutzerimonas stutzeri]MBD9410225.1 flagellin [Stutzerimonas stutzeri]